MGVGQLVVLDRAVLDVVADPLSKVLAHLQLLVAPLEFFPAPEHVALEELVLDFLLGHIALPDL